MKYFKELTTPDTQTAISQQVRNMIYRTLYEERGIAMDSSYFVYNSKTKMLSVWADMLCKLRYGSPELMSRRYGQIQFLMNRVTHWVRLPLPMSADDSYLYENTRDIETLSHWTKAQKIRLPYDFTDPKLGVQIVNRTLQRSSYSDDYSIWTDPGRPVAVINAMLKSFRLEPLSTDSSNALLAKIGNIHESAVYKCIWDPRSISQVYNEEPQSLNGSCMSGKPVGYFELYDHLQKLGRLKSISLRNGLNEHVGRALVWVGENPESLYLDRFYAPTPNGDHDPDCIQALKDFCQAEGITKTVWERNANNKLELEHVSTLAIPVDVGPEDFDHFPYVDSMKNWYSDDKIRNYHTTARGLSCRGEMQNTDGTSDFGGSEEDEDSDDYVELHDGSMNLREDSIFIESIGDWYSENDVVQLTLFFYGDPRWWPLDDSVEDFEGDWIKSDDAIEMHDGRFVHMSHARELYDGQYTHSNADESVITLEDDRLALKSECTEVDGVWYLDDEVPETEEEPAAAAAEELLF